MDAHRDKGLLEEHQEMADSNSDPAFSIADPNSQEGDVDGRI